MASISTTSASRSPTSLSWGSISNCNRMRVSGVRRSWLTPANISVRWAMCRWMRARMSWNAWAAWRTSVAPQALNSSASRPLPNASAAMAKLRIGLTWLRKNRIAIANSTNDTTAIHRMKINVVVLVTRSRRVVTVSTPSSICTRIAMASPKLAVSIWNGWDRRSDSALVSVRSKMRFCTVDGGGFTGKVAAA